MRGVGEPDRDHSLVAYRGACPDACGALDGGGVNAAVDYAPRCVTGGADLDVPDNSTARDVFEDEAGSIQEGTGCLQWGRVQPTGCGFGATHGLPFEC